MLVPQLHKKKILLAEDDNGSILLIEAVLQPTGVTISVVKNGLEAIEKLKQDPEICLILMDIQMPEMDGIEATLKIREFNSTIPIIAQTAFATADDKSKCQKAGFTAFIAKPIDVRLLYDTLWLHLCD
jgi:CheY-like chemotaxis protein